MNIIEKLYIIFKTLNMNDDNKGNCYGVSTDFIRKLTDLFFMVISEKASTNTPLIKMYQLKKDNTYMSICTHVLNVG